MNIDGVESEIGTDVPHVGQFNVCNRLVFNPDDPRIPDNGSNKLLVSFDDHGTPANPFDDIWKWRPSRTRTTRATVDDMQRAGSRGGEERPIAADQVRAHMNDGSVITLHDRSFEPIHVEGDQLIGYRTAEASSQAAEPGRMSLPLSNVREIDCRRPAGRPSSDRPGRLRYERRPLRLLSSVRSR